MKFVFASGEHTHVHRVDGDEGVTRALAHPSQVMLLRKLKREYVEVCSVNQLDGRRGLEADYVLEQMRDAASPPDQGGWRALGHGEMAALQFAASAEGKTQMPFLPMLVDRADAHPLIKSGVSFATNALLSMGLFDLMSDVYDIRRFSHPAHPNRLGRLRSYFRLAGPKDVLALYEGPSRSMSQHRASIIVSCWCIPQLMMQPRELIESYPTFFIFRDYYAHYEELAKSNSDAKAKGLATWKASLRFLTFVYQLWAGAVSEEQEFEPERFFTQDDEVQSFSQYINTLDDDPLDKIIRPM